MNSCPGCESGSATAADEGVERARKTYALGDHPAAREVELRTLGSDYGANGYATLQEVSTLPAILALGPGRRLLDIGAGQGWPGLYLAHHTGCEVVVTDVPFEGLAVAARRAARDGIASRAWCLVARGQTLPLRSASFDAAVHTDVLCCLRSKLATLRATHRALRPGGRTAFSVIFPTSDLPASQARQAIEAGPPNCALRTSYQSLLRSAGFVDVEEHDLTPAYLTTAKRKLQETERLEAGMVEILGRQEYDEMQAERRLAVNAIADGLLKRSLFVARRPVR